MGKNRILVLATGWHFSSHFYENMSKQLVPNNWEVDYYCVAHRLPDDENTITEKEQVRNKSCDNFLQELDKQMYKYPITKKQIEDFGWKFMLEPNTIGDMEVFNQWSEKYDYKEYDFILITHDDNFILSDKLFLDVIENNINVLKPIKNTRYGISNHQFKVEEVPINDGWMFIENGYSEYIPKAFEPRGSFCFYKKEFIDLLPNNKFDMTEKGKKILTRVGETRSIGYKGISAWNAPTGTLREWMYDTNLVEETRWFSNAKRVSRYCIEGERGLISNWQAGENYLQNIMQKMKDLNWV